jgi:D-alanine-D-alanine ligase
MKYSKNAKIAVVLGGENSEHEVSLVTGKAMADALRKSGYTNVHVVELKRKSIVQQVVDVAPEVILIGLHGRWYEDGCLQGLLELLEIPYSGCGVLSSSLCMDKAVSRQVAAAAGIAVPKFATVKAGESCPIAFPVFVKPSKEGSSRGVYLVDSAAGFESAVAEASAFAGIVLVEEKILGTEVCCTVVDGKAIGTGEIVPKNSFYDYESKYHSSGGTQYHFPARLQPQVENAVLRSGEIAYAAHACQGIVRVDFIVNAQGTPYLIELNTLPGLTPSSLVPKSAAVIGKSFETLVEELLQSARLSA